MSTHVNFSQGQRHWLNLAARLCIWRGAVCSVTALAGLAALAGCASVDGVRMVDQMEPQSQQRFKLLLPDGVSAGGTPATDNGPRQGNSAPIVIVACHGSGLDSPEAQLRAWAPIAARNRLIVIAPTLTAHGDWNIDQQVIRQSADERTILDAVDHVVALYGGDSGNVHLVATGNGALTARWSGLRNPEVFRSVCVQEGHFEPKALDHRWFGERFDPQQPVAVITSDAQTMALVGPAATAAKTPTTAWLTERGFVNVSRASTAAMVPNTTALAWQFIERASRSGPGLRVLVEPVAVSKTARVLTLTASERLGAVRWVFDDGTESQDRRFTREFLTPGSYSGTVYARTGRGPITSRRFNVTIE